MRSILFVLTMTLPLAAGAGRAAAAAAPPALADTVKTFVQTCSATDAAGFAALFTNSASITDELPPYHWQGKDMATAYIAALKDAIKTSGWDHFALVANGAPAEEATGGFGYATVPLFVNYVLKGKPAQDVGIFTLSLKQVGRSWKITSATWAYTKPPA